MLALVHAIPELERRTGSAPTIIGGLAVISRLGGGYRATSDLDTVNRRADSEPPQLTVLINSGATPSDAAGAMIPTPLGDVKVDVLEVADYELEQLPDDPGDRLHVLAHAWAAISATPLVIRATDPLRDADLEVVVKVAETGALIAMKLQSVENRPSVKEGTDLLDIVRLTLTSETRSTALAQLGKTWHSTPSAGSLTGKTTPCAAFRLSPKAPISRTPTST